DDMFSAMQSLIFMRVKILERASQHLVERKKGFGSALKLSHEYAALGALIPEGKFTDRLQELNEVHALLRKEARLKGPVSDMLTEVSRKYAGTHARITIQAAANFLHGIRGHVAAIFNRSARLRSEIPLVAIAIEQAEKAAEPSLF
ncbi:MAG: hypothetical protein LRY50_00150, partial [Geovibrio sp.]|nr:hypothetical protein [Geovibrio sp.]